MLKNLRLVVGGLAVLAAASCNTQPASPPQLAAPKPMASTAVSPPPAAAPAPAAAAPVRTAAALGNSPGAVLYSQHCAMCHENNAVTRAPTRESLHAMSFRVMSFALTGGKMRTQGASLDPTQRAQLINYLTGKETDAAGDWTKSIRCTANRTAVNLGNPNAATSVGFGVTRDNRRKLTARQAGLTTAQMSKLELAWAIAVPDASTMRAMGPVVGKTIFWPATDLGQVYALNLDGDQPCIQWVYQAPGGAPLRSSVAFGVLTDGTPLLVVAGVDATVHAIDARTGKAVWTKNVAYYSFSMTTGTPVVLKDRVIVPVSQGEITAGGDTNLQCCTNHGFVLSLDPKTGAQQWRYDTMPDATAQRNRGDGKPLMGPSGAPIWNSPAIDEKRGLIYFGTGESNSPPAHPNTDALIAIGLKDGKQRWSFQATPNDIFLGGCNLHPRADQLNCTKPPETVYRDVDFGGSVVIGRLNNGKQLLFSGQKSGSVWALDPDTGKVVWHKALGSGSALGGVHWGVAFDNDTVYAPIATVGPGVPGEWEFDPKIKSGLYALDSKTGKIKWQFNPTPPPGTPAPATGSRNAAWRGDVFSAVPLIIDGAVVTAAMDGTIYVNNAKTGKLLWSYQTARDDYVGVNGAKGSGGAIDANSLLAANGLLLANSGYATYGKAGNLLLGFRPKK